MSTERILTQLASTFTVREIMTETDKLLRAQSVTEAKEQLSQHPEYDMIPVPATGPVAAYLRRDDHTLKPISSQDLVSDGTSLLSVPFLMSKKDFFFVLSSNTIAGFVHFSDLNRSLMKLPYYVLLEAVEKHLWPLVSAKLGNSELPSGVIDPKRWGDLKERKARAEKDDVDIGWIGLLYFDEILRFASHFGVIALSNKDRETLVNIRNRVAHTDRLLVDSHKDVGLLVKTRELSMKLLNELQTR